MPESFELKFPLTDGREFQHTLKKGDTIFLLGANGTGKSSLVTRIFSMNRQHAKRISAHRQTWFNSNALDMTPNTRTTMDQNIRDQDSHQRSRHTEVYAAERAAIAIFDLIDADTMLARQIASLVRAKDLAKAERVAERPAPVALINLLMKSSNIPIEIEVKEQQIVVARKNGGSPYSIAELSDGERNAFLIAANVLTAKPGTLLLIDEPERHLHRAIISPLLTLLFAQRNDCAFVVSTHELMLPIDNPTAATLLIRSCDYENSQPKSWVADLLPAEASLDEGLKLDILGGRQKMMFVEGTTQSLDAPIYSLLFPQVSIIPKSNCRDVEYAVRGLRDSETKHWIKAWGIVDNDLRSEEKIDKLRNFGVYALPHYSVESLYYHPEIIRRIANRMAAVVGKAPEELFSAAVNDAIVEALKQRDHFVLGSVERLARRIFFDSLPSKEDIKSNTTVKIQVDVSALRTQEENAFDEIIKANDLGALLDRYPLRESGALGIIARSVGLTNRTDYENAVRVMLQNDPEAMSFMRSLFGNLAVEVVD